MPKKTPSDFAERLRFVVWLSALRRGFDSGKDLAEAIGKGPTQLSQWFKAKPTFATVRLLAEAVGVSPSWLDDPTSPDAREPELFAEWLATHPPTRKVELPRRKRA